MSKQGTIIVVDDNKGVLSAVKLLLKNHFEHIVTLPSPITLPAALREENAQVVLLDMNFSSGLNTGNEGLYWLHEIKKIHPSLPVVLFTAYADIDLAVRGIKEGATDFIVKPWDNARLIETLLSACRNLTVDCFSSPLLGRVFDQLCQCMAMGNEPSLASLTDFTSEEMAHIASVLQRHDGPVSEQGLNDCIRTILVEHQSAHAANTNDDLLAFQHQMLARKGLRT